ncbi:LexA family transcriptional regulator [Novosphingobium guangzhouense]|uniref:LexA family transcriptional regulator n=2 Tax=Novosphingobium guangzhouense TaxID=1850347 RepID=A0A2K2FUP1_9SPHN|nr:LexA family transcriptional regulator [Novosphingobium guangzhouense]PNU02501.1 LexA family transcriptional regulator [Novosphingobium guangzhouense]
MRYSHFKVKRGECDLSRCDNCSPIHVGSMRPQDIRAELDARNMSIVDLAEAIGMNSNYLGKALRGGRKLTADELVAIQEVLAPEDLAHRIRTIPLLGSVPAGKFQAAEQIGGRRIAVSDPETPPNAYALTVEGNSMDLVVPSGTTLTIDPDDKALWPGKRYVIQTEDGRTTYKEFQADPARLVPLSTDDSHQEMLLGSEPIVVVGRVYSYTMRDVDLPRRTR